MLLRASLRAFVTAIARPFHVQPYTWSDVQKKRLPAWKQRANDCGCGRAPKVAMHCSLALRKPVARLCVHFGSSLPELLVDHCLLGCCAPY